MKKNAIYVVLFLVTTLNSFAQTRSKEFKVVGYYVPTIPAEQIPIDLLTHINFAFAIPAKTGDTLEPLRDPEPLKKLVSYVHKHKKQVFISIGGWGIGDGGGDDTRFHKNGRTPRRSAYLCKKCNAIRPYL